MDYKAKNEKFFNDFENGNYMNLYYVDRSYDFFNKNAYYDLVVLQYEDYSFNAIPVPIFVERYVPEEERTQQLDVDVRQVLYDYVYETISDDEYYDMKEEARIIRENHEFVKSLSKEDKELLSDYVDVVIEREENQFGENVAISWLQGDYINGYQIVYVNCMNSSDLGFGTCNCVNHDIYKSYAISAEEALKILKSL